MISKNADHPVLNRYQEGDVIFLPTYKYNIDSDLLDTSKKKRAPAWCDRILYLGTGIR